MITYAKNTMGLALAQERYAGNFIRNQAAPSGVVKFKSPVGETALKQVKAEFDQFKTAPTTPEKFSTSAPTWTGRL
jgi:phage portal protein BeeE